MDFEHNFNSIPIIKTKYHSSVKVRVLSPWGGAGGRGGTHMRNYDVISGWQVQHLLIVHLNSFDLLHEMNGTINCVTIHFTQKIKGIEMDYQ